MFQELREAMSYTLPWNSYTQSSTEGHYKKHNSYGISHLNAVRQFYSSKDSHIFIMSATKSIEQAEPSLIQNTDASWDQLRNKLQNVLFESISGNHLVSVPVCGDNKNYDPSNDILCLRWYLMAATMPMLRISSVAPWRSPNNLNTTFVKNQVLNALDLRNQLLAHYYTILSRGEPVVRPMFYDYYHDEDTFSMDSQYMIGKKILVGHPLTPDRKRLHVYLPSDVEIWYEFWGGKMYNTTIDPVVNLTVLEDDFVAFLAQGTVLPLKVRIYFSNVLFISHL